MEGRGCVGRGKLGDVAMLVVQHIRRAHLEDVAVRGAVRDWLKPAIPGMSPRAEVALVPDHVRVLCRVEEHKDSLEAQRQRHGLREQVHPAADAGGPPVPHREEA